MNELSIQTLAAIEQGHVVRIPTSNGPDVVMDRADYEALAPHHREGAWFYNNNGRSQRYVYVTRAPTMNGEQAHPHSFRASKSKFRQSMPLARIVMAADAGRQVRYRNGDASDLRRENLVLR